MAEKENKTHSENANPNGGSKKFENKGRKFKKHDPKKNNKKSVYVPNYAPELMAKPIAEIGLSDQTVEILLKAGIDTLGKVCSRRAREMFGVQFFGKKQLKELSVALKNCGVDFRPDDREVKVESIESNKNPNKNANEKGKQKQNAEALKQKKDANEKANKNVNEKPHSVNVQQGNETKDNKNRQKNKDNSKKKDKGEELKLQNLFPREPFVPSPQIEAKQDPFIKFQRGSKWGFKDKNGKELIPPIYDEVFNFKGDYACVERKQMFGFINRENELIIPYKYDWASSFSEGFACVGNESKCGYITPDDVVVIPFIYDAGTPVVDGKAQVKQNGSWGTLDISTKTVDWGN